MAKPDQDQGIVEDDDADEASTPLAGRPKMRPHTPPRSPRAERHPLEEHRARRKSIALVATGLLVGGLLLQPTLSSAQKVPSAAPAAPVLGPSECKQWEVTQWSPQEDGGCKFSGAHPYSHRGEWCAAPKGTKIVGSVAPGITRFWIKRCTAR